MQRNTWMYESCLLRTIAQPATHKDVGSADSSRRMNRSLPDRPIKFAGANLTAYSCPIGVGQDARSKIPDPGEKCGLIKDSSALQRSSNSCDL